MSGRFADVIGLMGSTLIIGAYLYTNIKGAIDFRLFNAVNLLGASMLVASLTVHFNLAAMVVEAASALTAAFGLAKALMTRSRA